MDQLHNMRNNIFFEAFLFFFAVSAEYKINVIHTVAELGPNPYTYTAKLTANVSVKALYTVITGITALFANANGAKRKRKVIVNDKEICLWICFVKIEEFSGNCTSVIIK